MACYTQQEIAEAVNADQGDVSRMAKGFMEFGNLADSHKPAASHLTDFTVPPTRAGRNRGQGTWKKLPRRFHYVRGEWGSYRAN